MFVEKAFDLNDWVVLTGVLIIWTIYFLLPKTFSRPFTILVMLYGVTVASVFDNSFGAKAFDFYDIMDGPAYTFMDAVVYLLYPPYAYFFMYFLRLLKIKSYMIILYILVWSLASVLLEFFYTFTNVFSYKNGYNLYYSFCIYLTVQSGLLLFSRALEEKPLAYKK